jgi:hypothetical protein
MEKSQGRSETEERLRERPDHDLGSDIQQQVGQGSKEAGPESGTGLLDMTGSNIDTDTTHTAQRHTRSKSNENAETLDCMYTNLDSFLNKKNEILLKLADENPDIVALCELKPKNARYLLE